MVSRSNTHVKKFNQLVEVHDPDGIEQLEPITTRDPETLRQRRDQISALQESVADLPAEALFDEAERAQIADADSMPPLDEVAASKCEEMLNRLDEIEAALDDALADGETLDASDDLSF